MDLSFRSNGPLLHLCARHGKVTSGALPRSRPGLRKRFQLVRRQPDVRAARENGDRRWNDSPAADDVLNTPAFGDQETRLWCCEVC